MYGLDEDLVEPDPPPTKSVRESMVAIAIALAIGTAAVSLFSFTTLLLKLEF